MGQVRRNSFHKPHRKSWSALLKRLGEIVAEIVKGFKADAEPDQVVADPLLVNVQELVGA